MLDMRFIKKNLFLVGFIGVSALCALVLLVFSVLQYFEMSESIEETNKLRDQNEKLIRRKIPAVPENIDRVQENINGYDKQEKLNSIYYGQPLYPALKSFCDKLKTTPEDLRENFKRYYADKKYAEKELRNTIYIDFRDSQGRGINNQHAAIWNYEENINATPEMEKLPLWEDAMDAFKAQAQLTTIEKIDNRNIEEIFLSSLGVPRNMDDSDNAMLSFRRYMSEKISAMYENKDENLYIDILGINFFRKNPVAALKSDKDFNDERDRKKVTENNSNKDNNSSGSNTNTEKATANKTDEIRHWDIVCDLSRRIVDAKVGTVEEMSYNDLAGKADGSCNVYTYTLSVTGSEESLRKLLNNLNKAYKDHRVYVVRNLSIHKQEDQIQDIIDFEKNRIGSTIQSNQMTASDSGSSFAGNSSDNNKVTVEEEFFKEEHKTNECIAGRSNVVSATMVLDYVVYNVSVR